MAIRPYGVSRDARSVAPPSSPTLVTAASVSSTAKYTDQCAGTPAGEAESSSPIPPTSVPPIFSVAYRNPAVREDAGAPAAW